MSPFDKKLNINWDRVVLDESYKLHRPGIEPGSLAWKASILTIEPSV